MIMQDPEVPEELKVFLRDNSPETIRLDAKGRWWHQGQRFENKRISDLFHRSVVRTKTGTWLLKIGQFTHPIEVECTGYFISRIENFDKIRMICGEYKTPNWDSLSTNNKDIIALRVDNLWARLLAQAYRRIVENLDFDENINAWITQLDDHELVISSFDTFALD